ncbi:S41 family peptidase [Filimonas effusa]|uniref:Tail specific protease domain-containing protein n=1 Tax=Filimonas effusa TaxID=2508721 RepID=A0A4Q1D7W0_9BACT|nr:S41 family peptidase [Filimonas effusa]RXK83851.1 hypothetical protein ESB13_17430 [Filimonas effusa]
MKHNYILLLLLFFSSSIYSQNIPVLTPIQLKQDIDSLVKYLDETHINPYYRYPKQLFQQDVIALKKRITKDLNILDFYVRIQPLLGKLEDGHTDLYAPEDSYNILDLFRLPYHFKLNVTAPFITCEKPFRGFNAEIPAGAEIITINAIPAKQIVDDIVALNTGESRSFRAEYGAQKFNFYLGVLYKMNGNYTIRYKHNNQLQTIFIQGARSKQITDKFNESADTTSSADATPLPCDSYYLQIIDSIAIIDFKSFSWNCFKRFSDSAFTVIKKAGIKDLVLNLIDNGGGDSDVGDAFFQYILDKPFTQYDKVVEKNSRLLKARLNKHLLSRKADASDSALLAKPNGSIDTVHYSTIAIEDNPLRFKGSVYLLINGQTYSSAADFAQCFKHYKRGLIIGEETGGLIKSYGDIVSTQLPNSKLRLIISSKLYYNIGATDEDWKGVVPDITATKDKALSVALKTIRDNRKVAR